MSVARKAGLHQLSLCAAFDILRYAGCSPASPVEVRPKSHCKYDSEISPQRSWLSHGAAENVWPLMPLILRNTNTKVSQQLFQHYCALGNDSVFCKQVAPGIFKDFHPAVKNKPQPLLTQCTWSTTKDLQLRQHHCNNLKSPTFPT